MSVSYIPRLPSRLSTAAMNTRFNSSTFAQSPSKLALLSHHKLQQESSAEEPDLRRCLGHNAVLSKTMTAARRDVSYHRKSSRFSEDNGVDGYISRKEGQGSVVRAQLAKAVRGWIRRRSMVDANAKTINTTITATAPTTTAAKTPTTTTTTTTTPNSNALARVAANNSRDTENKWSTFSSLKRLVSGRKFWAQPVLMQTTAG
ncbi:uncharacterized protein EURHEDRAFT_417228 [Aspergillus ruber CBS 135680]|uniref:Uncharacterized protein n=1 Tax=Aspergillus ruber (strain CBS 135680) TaxID=1388766 RepID=A0A017S3D9_ASPRC|nr:uncharacterized protein EURHEDRAFT_417228 [Aspergillus ruber CBS 135680]EYE90695.1 hypothetical protein EURHEDRAFT_417228 [Aspergillus ruber CBS 135680]